MPCWMQILIISYLSVGNLEEWRQRYRPSIEITAKFETFIYKFAF